MSDPACAPATKADVRAVKSELKIELGEVKADIAGVKTDLAEVKADLAGVKADLVGVKTDLAGVKTDLAASTKRLAHEIIKTNVRIDRLGTELRGEMRALRADVVTTMDTAVSRMETLWRESAILPRVIDDHARRIAALEARPPR